MEVTLEKPSPTPIKKLVIELDGQEATDLMHFFGCLTGGGVANLMGNKDREQSDRVYKTTSNIYYEVTDELDIIL